MAYSYHCLCNNFILATIHNLSQASRRKDSAADSAIILPVGGEASTVLPGVNQAKEPMMVQREDGFEKRWQATCDRCGIALGYYLDWLQFVDGNGPDSAQTPPKEGCNSQVLYLLPGAMVLTEDMQEGKRPPEKELKLKPLST